MNTLTLRVAARYFAASLVDELRQKMEGLLKDEPIDPAKGDAIAAWLAEHFYFLSPKTPKGQKEVKNIAERLHWMLKNGIRMHGGSEGVRKTIESDWKLLEPHLANFVKYFSAEGGKVVPKELKLDGHLFINGAGLEEKKLTEYAERLNSIFKDLKGWRRKALAGGLKVRFANPKDFAGSAGGKYRSSEDTLFVRTTTDVLKREGKAYGGFEYIIAHELGHRYEHKVRLPDDFDKQQWWTTPYSRNEGESFAELFALTNFGITSAHTKWDPELNDKFEKVMSGSSEEPRPGLPQHLQGGAER